MYFPATNRISLKREAYRSYFSTFSIFLGSGSEVHFVTPEVRVHPRPGLDLLDPVLLEEPRLLRSFLGVLL